jgi:hypothetical protein
VGSDYTDNIIVDTKPPVSSLNPDHVDCTNANILDIELNCTDDGSCDSSYYQLVSTGTVLCPSSGYSTYNGLSMIDIL